jgi:hypothetical protein
MRTTAKVLALALLLALKPACGGGGGGGGGSGGSGLSFPAIPALAPAPSAGTANLLGLAATPGAHTITVTGMSDAAVQAQLQTYLNGGGNIVMTNGGAPRTVVLTGILDMPSTGASPNTVILDGSGDITLSGGLSTGILQIHDKADLTVQRMKFLDARAGASGGGVNSLARVRHATFIQCTFTNCQTTQAGPDIGGGAIRIANGQITQISGCTFDHCAGSNGGAVNSLGTQLSIFDSTFKQNAAFGTGGGADVGPSGQGGIGGAVYVDNVSNPDSISHQLTITGCVFNANVANAHAGAVFGYMTEGSSSTTTIDQCTFAGGVVTNGHSGALYSQSDILKVQNSTFNQNSVSDSGGAVFCINDSSTFTNCTFQGNTCSNVGGAIFAPSGNLTLHSVTLAQNSAGQFAGGVFAEAPPATTNILNCVFSANTALGNIYAGDQVNNSYGGGFNVQAPQGAPGAKPASATGTGMFDKALLGPLKDNTGPTFTMQPLLASGPDPDSPAINAADVATAPALDQRGHARNGNPDAGACEGPP